MREERILTKSGYLITMQYLNEDINHIIIKDTNLYPDSDSRSTENREWLIPINNLKDLGEIGNLFLKLSQK